MSRVRARLGVVVVAVCLLVASLQTTGQGQAVAQEQGTGYLMAHFTGESPDGEQIYLAHSDDGLHWTDLNNGGLVLRSTIGTRGVRDPAIVRSPSGDRYWVIATDLRIAAGTSWWDAANRGSRSLVVWESTDLVNWSAPWLLNVAGAIPDAGDAWAPEAIYDASTGNYVVYWATNSTVNGVKKHRVWYARTSDFRGVSAPQVYIDRAGGEEIIDTQIVEVSDRTGGWRYYRASRDNQITIEASNSIVGSWTRLGDISHTGVTGVEGPMWAKFNDRDEWALWLDQYATGRGYMALTSTNLGSTQNFRRAGSYHLGSTLKRHGSILNLTATEESRVLGRWASAPTRRLQSYNFQDRYVRHADYDVRLDANVSPAQDAQFRPVPGLANGSAGHVSFESVSHPGHFLRHYGFDLRLERSDGSATFRADATFRQVSGLADGSWSSFQSYNFPDRYLRHYNYVLRVDPISDAVARADATFRITS